VKINLMTGVVLVMFVALAAPASAQEAEAQKGREEAQKAEETELESGDQQEVSGPEGRVFEDQIVVTAGRQEVASGDVPAPITVITRDEIDKQQPEKMADLFKSIPGVEIQGEGPFRGIPVIRGLSSNRVLILVDGQRLNNARESTDFAGIQPALVNLAEVERIEVLRGPASVQYGSDAIGGVVNIITRKPALGGEAFKVTGNVAYEYGTSSDSQHGRALVTGAGKGMSFHIGASVQDVGNYTAASGAADDERYQNYVLADDTVPNSGMRQSDFDASLSVLTGEQGVFKVNTEIVRSEDIGFPGFDPATSGVDISFPKFDRSKLAVGWESGPVWGLEDITLSAWYQGVDKESIRNLDFGFFYSNSYTRSEIDSYGFNAQSIADLGASHHLTFGLDFYQDKLHDTAQSETAFTPPSDEVAVPDSTQRGLGLYIIDSITVGPRLTLDVGLRGDTFSFVSQDDPRYTGEPFDVNDSALSGNLGVVYAVTDHVNLTGLIARGFRTPNIQERAFTGFASTGDTFIQQNPDLNSESSWNYEVGFKTRYDRYSGGLHLFYNDLTDFIALEFLGPDPVNPDYELAQFANIEKATIQGVELDLEVIFAKWWTAFGTFAYLEGDNKVTEEPLSSIPPYKVVLGVRYQRSSWWAEADVRYVGSQTRLPTDDPRYETGTRSFNVFDLRGGYDFGFGLGVLVSLENITDELYNEPYNNRPEPGRNLRATLRYLF
jgi:hemoglobin/transferrin/lactoferrin receptor protein